MILLENFIKNNPEFSEHSEKIKEILDGIFSFKKADLEKLIELDSKREASLSEASDSETCAQLKRYFLTIFKNPA